jgi:hypothetical protein
MSFYKLPHRPIRQAAPFALGNEFGAFLARRPRSHGKSAGEDRLSSREEIGAPVHLADWSCAAEIAMVSPTRHDAGTGVIERLQICHAALKMFGVRNASEDGGTRATKVLTGRNPPSPPC